MLSSFIDNPSNPRSNFNLALEYESLNQTAAAASFYLRAAEKTNNPSLQYMALIRNAICFDKQGNRDLTVKTLLQRAISIMPERPEGYYQLAKLYEKRKEFHDLYMIACIGLDKSQHLSIKPLPSLVDYFEKYKLLFLKSVGAWWVGLTEESRDIQFDLYFNYQKEMDDTHRMAVKSNLENIGFPNRKLVYTCSLVEQAKYRFNNIERIKHNYSQVYQDMFVLTVLDGKQGGTYLEIGSGDPFYNNNTALLETVFGWTGVSIDVNSSLVDTFNAKRKNKALCLDASAIDYQHFLKEHGFAPIIDYLQLDCDPPPVTLKTLQKVLLSGFKFKVITFEHDSYADDQTQLIKRTSRELLTSHGYTLLVPDVSFNKTNPFEDWWVLETVKKFTTLQPVNFAQDLFLFNPVINV